MKHLRFASLFRSIAIFSLACAPAIAADLSGTWKFSVDLSNGEHGDPVFVLKQVDGKLTGIYRGPFGKWDATGTLKGDAVSLEVTPPDGGGYFKLSYTGKLQGDSQSSSKMTGSMTRTVTGTSTEGKWTALRSK